MKMVLSLDQGTTGTRAILYDLSFSVHYFSYLEHTQYFPKPGWVEHDPQEIFENCIDVIKNVVTAFIADGGSVFDIICMGLSNQGESVVAWDKISGEALSPIIVWQCRRTANDIENLQNNPELCALIHHTTGLLPDPYFSASKIRWLINHVPAVTAAEKDKRLCIGTLDTWLIFKLTQGASYLTDCTTASRTMLLNLQTLDWDDEMLKIFGLQRSLLPAICENNSFFGVAHIPLLPALEIPVTASVVDQQGALFGQGCFEKGSLKATYGTGGFMLMNTGDRPVLSENGILTTLAWSINGEKCYALDGGIYIAGAALQWLKKNLRFFNSYDEIDDLANSVSNDGLYFVPAFSGLAAPYWDSTARGMIIGITGGTEPAHFVRATLESIAYQFHGFAQEMQLISRQSIIQYLADGGVSKSDWMMQFQSDILQQPVFRLHGAEATARGTAMIAAVGAGEFSSLEDFNKITTERDVFVPQISADERDSLYLGWERAVQRTLGWSTIHH